VSQPGHFYEEHLMSNFYPLLDIRQAIADADRNLADVIFYVTTLQEETEGHYPPEAAELLDRVAEVRTLLTTIIPPALWQAIVTEQAEYDSEELRWEPSNY
jgi:hypothetical protein